MALKIGNRAVNEILRTTWVKLSGRERGIVVAGILVLIFIVVHVVVYTPIKERFVQQQRKQAEIHRTIEVIPDMLGRYSLLLGRRREIEQFYEKLDLRKPALSHLEDLLRNVANVPSGSYTVTTRTQPDFAGKYKHESFLVRFDTSSMENLAAFLRNVVQGQQPMLLSQITIERKMSADALSVQVEVSSFKKG